MSVPSDSPRAMTRRSLLKAGGRGALRIGIIGGLLGSLHSYYSRGARPRTLEQDSMGLLRPPGALDDDMDFLSACSRCELCSQACDAQCIKLFGPEEGRHAGTPYILAESAGCDICMECTLACPTGALQKLEDTSAITMGLAIVDEDLCVSFNGSGVCGACHSICPVPGKAIKQGRLLRPTVLEDSCVGCGMCTEVCPVDGRKAIRVKTSRSFA